MEELKILVGMVADLPEMALWVIAFFFVYKVVIIGSIYGVIKLGITRLHDWAITPRDKIITEKAEVDIGSISIRGKKAELLKQLKRLRYTDYIHEEGVEVLRVALDEYFEKHGESTAVKNKAD